MNYRNLSPIVFDLFNRVKKIGRSKYKIGKYMISIPPNFALPKLQSTVKLYDRFLPVLASKIDAENKLIIDVGANIGDTTIAMMQHCKNRFLCIEPSSVLPYLEENIKNLSPEDYKRISIIKKLVGTGNLFGELKHRDRGTAMLYFRIIHSLKRILDWIHSLMIQQKLFYQKLNLRWV